jgi:hypothetical protein
MDPLVLNAAMVQRGSLQSVSMQTPLDYCQLARIED